MRSPGYLRLAELVEDLVLSGVTYSRTAGAAPNVLRIPEPVIAPEHRDLFLEALVARFPAERIRVEFGDEDVREVEGAILQARGEIVGSMTDGFLSGVRMAP